MGFLKLREPHAPIGFEKFPTQLFPDEDHFAFIDEIGLEWTVEGFYGLLGKPSNMFFYVSGGKRCRTIFGQGIESLTEAGNIFEGRIFRTRCNIYP